MSYGESEYIYGIHASSAGDGDKTTCSALLFDKGQARGWIVFTEGIGRDPGDMSSRSYLPWADQGLGIIVRLNHGYGDAGTIPLPEHYADFAIRCGNYVAKSTGCHIWIVGNEPNHSQERPDGMPITPQDYAFCYSLCREQIKSVQPEAQVLLAGPSPWNWESGDFGWYWDATMFEAAQRGGFDGVAIHTYTHGPDPAFIFDDAQMGPPGEAYHWQFRVYQDLLMLVPAGTPIYITETNQEEPWSDTNSGWVKNAYREIHDWNRAYPEKTIRALCLYRCTHDRWAFQNKAGVQADLMEAIEFNYKWTEEPMPEPTEWTQVYFDGLELPFYDQDGAGELTLPPKHRVIWDESLSRPEMDAKIAPQPEVYLDGGKQSAVGFLPYKTFKWWVHTTDPIPISAGVRTRVSVACMIVAHGIDGDNSRPGACGMRVGLSSYTVYDPHDANILWSDWWVVRGSLENEYVWTKLQTPETIFQVGQVRLWIQCNADVAATISAGHWDCETVEQYGEVEPPEPPPEPGCRGATPDEVRQIIREELANVQISITLSGGSSDERIDGDI